jgi:predicted ArsR family transcriptional regulator
MAVGDLAAAVGLHANTAREHLDRLIDAGLVASEVAPPAGRGRPSLRYRATRWTDGEDLRAFRDLAAALATELERRPDAPVVAVRAGERWGRAAAVSRSSVGTTVDPVDRLVDLLDDAGYAPERPGADVGVIRLRRCPFGALAGEHRDVVCGIHLGLMRGALAELGAPFEEVSLQPFAEPGICLAHVPG